MKEFVHFTQSWQEVCRQNASVVQRCMNILQISDEPQIRSNFELLYSLGEFALCAVLQKKNDQIIFNSVLPSSAHGAWLCAIMEEIAQEDSIWNPLYCRGDFALMRRDFWTYISKYPLSYFTTGIQKLIIQESQQLRSIPAGSFVVEEEVGGNLQKHKVTLTTDYKMGCYLVSQGVFSHVMGYNPSHFQGCSRPVENVTWAEALLFCNRLGTLQGRASVYLFPDGLEDAIRKRDWRKQKQLIQYIRIQSNTDGYQIPTEAQWSYAACAGDNHSYAGGEKIVEVAWYKQNAQRSSHPVGLKKPNKWGLYDMSGNVSSWTMDSWSDVLFQGTDRISPLVYDPKSERRVYRGGGWNTSVQKIKMSHRFSGATILHNSYVGFRICLQK